MNNTSRQQSKLQQTPSCVLLPLFINQNPFFYVATMNYSLSHIQFLNKYEKQIIPFPSKDSTTSSKELYYHWLSQYLSTCLKQKQFKFVEPDEFLIYLDPNRFDSITVPNSTVPMKTLIPNQLFTIPKMRLSDFTSLFSEKNRKLIQTMSLTVTMAKSFPLVREAHQPKTPYKSVTNLSSALQLQEQPKNIVLLVDKLDSLIVDEYPMLTMKPLTSIDYWSYSIGNSRSHFICYRRIIELFCQLLQIIPLLQQQNQKLIIAFHCLIKDDHPICTLLLEQILQQHSIQIITASATENNINLFPISSNKNVYTIGYHYLLQNKSATYLLEKDRMNCRPCIQEIHELSPLLLETASHVAASTTTFSKRIITISWDGSLCILQNNQTVTCKLLHHREYFPITMMRWDEEHILVGCSKGQLFKWNITTATLVSQFCFYEQDIYCIIPSDATDAEEYFVSYGDGMVFCIRNNQIHYKWKAHSQSIGAMLLLSDIFFVTGSDEETISLWDRTTLAQPTTPIPLDTVHEHKGFIYGLVKDVVQQNGMVQSTSFYSASADQVMKQWIVERDEATQRIELRSPFTLRSHKHSVHQMQWKNEGNELWTCSYDKTIKKWNTKTKSVEIELQNEVPIWSFDFIDDMHLACGGKDGKVRIWNLQSKSIVFQLPIHSKSINKLFVM